MATRERPVFPVFLKLAGRAVLVVGGGAVAASKVDVLRRSGARLSVVAPRVSAAIGRAGVAVARREFRPADLDGVWLVVAAATPAVNRRVARLADRRRVFVNAVDDPENATAYLGGVFRRGDVTVAISTNGRAPALAGLLREGLDALVPAGGELDRWFRRSDALRRQWRRNGVPMAARRPALLAALDRLYSRRAVGPAEEPWP